MSDLDPKQLTVGDAFWRCVDRSVLQPKNAEKFQTAIACWEKHSTDPPISGITEQVVGHFRDSARIAEYKDSTINTYIEYVLAITTKFRPFSLKRGRPRRRAALTLREAATKYYVPAFLEMSPRTITKLKHNWNSWERLTDNPRIEEISEETFRQYRERGLEANLSPTTIENIISDALTVLRFCARHRLLALMPMAGKRLRRRLRVKDTPTVAELAAAYKSATEAEWPHSEKWKRVRENGKGRFMWSSGGAAFAALWWQSVLCALYFTAMRRGDLLTLKWDEVQSDRIVRTMQKTGFDLVIPIHPILREHLDKMPRSGPFVFGRNGSLKQIREQMQRITRIAVGRGFTFQSLRRTSAQAWERARAGCGTLILGHQFRGADRFYLTNLNSLSAAIPQLEVPPGMGSSPDRAAAESEALESLKQLDRGVVLKLFMELLGSSGGAV